MKSVENEGFLGFLPISQALLTQEHCIKDSKGRMNEPNGCLGSKVICQSLGTPLFLPSKRLSPPAKPVDSPGALWFSSHWGIDEADILQEPLKVGIWIMVHLPQVAPVILALISLPWHLCFKCQFILNFGLSDTIDRPMWCVVTYLSWLLLSMMFIHCFMRKEPFLGLLFLPWSPSAPHHAHQLKVPRLNGTNHSQHHH